MSHSSIDAGALHGPLPLFDHHLKLLEESYIQFFQERVIIEEVYVESLRRLQQKHRALDTYRDDRSDRGASVRRAWREIGDNAERETDTREAFLENLKAEILSPLVALKEIQERTRKRIKEDLKSAIDAHLEYADHVLPRLKRSYLKKCQEVEDLKSDKPTHTHTHTHTHTAAPTSQLAYQTEQPLAKVTSNPIGSPMPIRPPVRQASVHQHNGGRNRSPSTSTPFSDLAHQGKKQLNSIMTFLNESGKSGPAKEISGGRPEVALRSVKAKREADEADKDYRKGVHWLETLRLHRVKTLESGYKSLESFVQECSETVKVTLQRYTDGLMATSATIIQLTNHVEPMVRAISPTQDTAAIAANIPRSMARETPRPTLYYNYTVGECRDLIFGIALVDYSTAHNLPEGAIPKVVDLCIKEVEARGMDTEGIYRISGRHANVQELTHKIERDERSFKFNPTVDDVSCVASMLKLYLRELPEPLFRLPLAERFQHTEDREDQVANNFPFLRPKLRRLPPVHQATLRRVVEHLSRVSSRNQFNKMDAKNLAIVFGSVIFGEDELPKGADILSMQNWKDTVMEDLIIHASLLFHDQSLETESPQTEPPLPPAPSGEPKPTYDYGSSYTQVTTLPPRTQEGQDFTPTLPARPGQSIHPSRRSTQLPPRDQDIQAADTLPASSVEISSTNQSYPSEVQFLSQTHVAEEGPTDSKASSVDVGVADPSVTQTQEEDVDDVPTKSPETPDNFATPSMTPPHSPKGSMPSTETSAQLATSEEPLHGNETAG